MVKENTDRLDAYLGENFTMVDVKIETSKERLSAVESNMARIDELEKLHQSLSDKLSSNTKAISEN